MAQNQEQIEARLCDYIEGTLTDAERADIEKHLASNPQHRKLIGELLKTRDLVRRLPRAKAPADVAETLQGQLERSVLLGSMPDELPASHLRIGFWSRFRAIAAMLILAAGLGSVVFFMLRNTRSPELATLQPKINATEAAATSQPAENEPGALGGPVVMADSVADKAREPARGAEVNGSAAPLVASAPSAVSNAFANDSGSIANRRAASADDAMFGTTLADHLKTAAGANEAECIVSDAPSKDVIRYLQDNKITWRVEPMPQPLALNVNQSAAGSRLTQNSMRLESRPIEPVARDRQEAKAKEQAPFGGGGAKPATMPIDGSSLASNAPAQKQSEEDTKRALEAPATMPTEVALDALAQQQLQQRYICAPNLTRQQADDLRANLSRSDQYGESLAKRGAGRKQLAESSAPAEKDRDYGIDASRNGAPTTLPAANIAAAMPAPTTQASSGAFTLATTMPTTGPAAEQRFDVFIVVDAAGEAPATAPSTQPSTQPASQPSADAVDDVTSFK